MITDKGEYRIGYCEISVECIDDMNIDYSTHRYNALPK